MSTEVERIYCEISSLKKIIDEHGGPSDIVAFEALAAKCLLLAAASYYEKTVCGIIERHAKDIGASDAFVEFINNQALSRKYHTLFDWEKSNVNKFVRLFGGLFFKFMETKLACDDIKEAAREFMALGQGRNLLVHNNFAEYAMGLTSEDIKNKFDAALPLMTFFAESLRAFESSNSAPNGEDVP